MREHKEIGSKPVSYYYLRNKNLIIGTTARAASSSMHKILSGKSTISQERVSHLRSYIPVVIWFRDPFDRFASAYDIFKHRRSFGEFIEHAINVHNNHWIPQTTLHSYKNTFLPTTVLPFKSLNESWERLMPEYPLLHLKKKKRISFDELRKSVSLPLYLDLAKYYIDDLVLHRKIAEE